MRLPVKQRLQPVDIAALAGLAAIAWRAGAGSALLLVLVMAALAAALLPVLRRVLPRTPVRSIYWPACIGLSLLGLVLVVDDPYELTLLGLALYASLALTGLSLIAGSAGQVSFAHVVFIGIGAYTFGVLADRVGINAGLGLLAAGAAGALAGLIIGLPAVQIRGQLFLAVATISIAVAFGPLLNLESLEPLIGGSLGLQVFEYVAFPPAMTDLMSNEKWIALLALACLGLGMALAAGLKKTSVGRSMLAVRENETVATSLGIPVRRLKVQVFVISAAYAGVAGGLLFLLSNRYVSPGDFDLPQMIVLYVVLMLGGARSLAGAMIGGFLLVYGYQTGLSEAVNGALSGSLPWNMLLAAAIVLTTLGLMRRSLRERRASTGNGDSDFRPGRAAGAAAGAIAVIVGLAFLLRWLLELRNFPATGVVGAVAGIVLIVTIAAFPHGIAGVLTREGESPDQSPHTPMSPRPERPARATTNTISSVPADSRT